MASKPNPGLIHRCY